MIISLFFSIIIFQTQALALTRPKSDLVLTLQNETPSLSGNENVANMQHQQPLSYSSTSSIQKQSIEQKALLSNENKAQNMDQGKNQLMNFGSHEKPSHNNVQYQQEQHQTHQPQHQPQHQQQQQQQKQIKPLANQQQSITNVEARVSPKTNCFNISAVPMQTETALASTDDNTISGNSNQQSNNDNCPPTTPLAVNLKLNSTIPTATSPLIENGNNSASAYMQEKYLPSSTTSPSDLRKEFDAKVNGEF